MSTHDFKKYKESLAVLPHLDSILKVLNLSERSLAFYQNFIPVSKVLACIKDQKRVLELYKTTYQKIKTTKGAK